MSGIRKFCANNQPDTWETIAPVTLPEGKITKQRTSVRDKWIGFGVVPVSVIGILVLAFIFNNMSSNDSDSRYSVGNLVELRNWTSSKTLAYRNQASILRAAECRRNYDESGLEALARRGDILILSRYTRARILGKCFGMENVSRVSIESGDHIGETALVLDQDIGSLK